MFYKDITKQINDESFLTKEYGCEIYVNDSTFEYISKFIKSIKYIKDIKMDIFPSPVGGESSRLNIKYINNKSIYMWAYKDDYFIVKYHKSYQLVIYYACDGLDGLLQCLSSIYPQYI